MITTSFRTVAKSRSEIYYLVPIGDIHLGTKNCDEVKLKQTVDWIRQNKNVYWVGMGDYGDFINYTDKRFDPSTLAPHFLQNLDNLHIEQANYLIKLFKPIKERCLGLLEGNHDDLIRTRYHCNVVDYMAGALGTSNLSYVSMIRWSFARQKNACVRTIDLYLTHGFGGGMTDGGPLNRLEREGADFEADIYLMGHVHKKLCADRDVHFLNSKGDVRLQLKKRIYGITGTFLQTYKEGCRNYAEMKGYSPTPLGTLKIRIEPFKASSEIVNGKRVFISRPVHLHISA